MIKSKTVSESKTVMTEMIMPNDTNPMGNLMGGNLMRWMDIAGAICAARHCEVQVATASVDHISFHHPIRLGHTITLIATVTRAFKSSLEVYVEVSSSEITGKNLMQTNHAYFTFVGLDNANGHPVKVPELIPTTDDENKRFESASRRRELRLILAGRMKAEDASELRTFFKEFDKK